MDRRLSNLIKDYQRRVGDAVAMLEAAGIPRPLSNTAWVESDDFGRVSLPDGFTAYKHGFGCAVDGPEWGVDFDFGASGRIDGFDSSRLYDFARRRLREYEFSSEKDIESAVRLAAEAGELEFSGYILYYLTDTAQRDVDVAHGFRISYMDDVIPIRKPEIIGEAGGLVDGSRLTLGIHGEDLDPDEISRLLGCAPTSAHRRGDARRSGTPWPKGAWLFSVEGKAPTGPEELIHLLLARLPADDGPWSALRTKYRVRLSFGIFSERWNRGFELSADAVRQVNALGAGLDVDIYANLEDDNDG